MTSIIISIANDNKWNYRSWFRLGTRSRQSSTVSHHCKAQWHDAAPANTFKSYLLYKPLYLVIKVKCYKSYRVNLEMTMSGRRKRNETGWNCRHILQMRYYPSVRILHLVWIVHGKLHIDFFYFSTGVGEISRAVSLCVFVPHLVEFCETSFCCVFGLFLQVRPFSCVRLLLGSKNLSKHTTTNLPMWKLAAMLVEK